jgi:glycosyltransferase involved in cell wall biosynthesis
MDLTPITYLVTCHDESDTLRNLLAYLKTALVESLVKGDEVVVVDDFSTNKETVTILDEYRRTTGFNVLQHKLDNNYGEHKNWGNQQCKGAWIFQIDGDELPSQVLTGDNLRMILYSNPETELFFVPRINDFQGVNAQHARTWGWQLTESPMTGRPRVNFPDYQGRIYKNAPERIKWERRLHEKIEGHKKYAYLPAAEEFALLHVKTIEKQVETNLRYNKAFTEAENRGYKLK